MWNRYDPQSHDRDRDGSWDRSLGSRGGTSDRDRNEERDPRDVFTKDLDLPCGRQRRPVRERDRVYEINASESRSDSCRRISVTTRPTAAQERTIPGTASRRT
jgi:hypothetical protein